MGFADVVVPADWPAIEVIAWMAQARDMAKERDKADEDERSAERTAEDKLLSEIQAQLDGEAW
jgi:hypothetical protein